ncbi:RNA polymerase sigma factor [Bdellovibrionota bacterium FG-1]
MNPVNDPSSEALMTAYQQGDEAAFAALYQRHSRKVYGFLVKKLRDQAMADDVFQATFLKLHQSRASYDPAFGFLPWLFTICRNTLIDAVRKKQRTQEDADPVAIENAQERVQEEGHILPDLAVLSVTQRQAIELRYSEDLSFEKIAEKLSTSPVNVRQLISRAVKKLRSVQ